VRERSRRSILASEWAGVFVPDAQYAGEYHDPTLEVETAETADPDSLDWQPVWIHEFLAYCAERDVPLDFLSTHLYPTDYAADSTGRAKAITRHADATRRDLELMREIIEGSPYPDLELQATVITPAWATGIIAENAAGLEGWRIADAFPDGGGNWGGSFFAVPAAGKHTDAAVQLADFLTSPEAAVSMFLLNGQFPSQLEAMQDPAVAETANEFFGGQETGAIYAGLAESAGDKAAGGYRGVNFAGIQTLVMDGIRRIESGNEDAADAWNSSVAEFDALGLTD